ncbi:MAG: DUF4390 domain-containing protein [Methylococcales bacterium]|nr:DUF4390 domain-containing protein [Methylococcales bacterium]
MRACVNVKRGWWLACLLTACQPAPEAVQVARLTAMRAQNTVNVQANITFDLPELPRQALHSGIPLIWQVELKVAPQTLYEWAALGYLKTRFTLRIDYRALTGRYALTRDGRSESFASLAEVLAAAQTITQALTIAEASWPRQLAWRMRFDYEQLPLPLRPFAYFDAQWALSTSWQVCPAPE